MKRNIIIRQASHEDIETIEVLYGKLCDALAGVKQGPRWSRGVYPLREHAEEGLKNRELYVAEIDGTIVGTVIYLHEQGDIYREVKWQIEYDVPVIVIHVLAVHPDYFGCGVGKALLDYACELGRNEGVQAIRLDMYEENILAERLYERCGFRFCGMIDLGLEEIYGLKWYKTFEKVINFNKSER